MDATTAERRAPGWEGRCLRCGHRYAWGLVGIRIGAASRGKMVLARCPRCRKIGCQKVVKRVEGEPVGAESP